MATDTSNSKELEWEERTLCSDDACIGIIGPNGRCNECGKPYTGKAAGADGDSGADEDLTLAPDRLLDDDGEDALDEDLDEIGLDDEADSHWEDRILCRDESCIGVIGPDGRCKECGKPLDEGDAS